MHQSLRKAQDDAWGSKAGAKAEAQAMGQAQGERCKPVQEDMGVHHGDCPSRELGACLKFVSDEWGEQVPKQMETSLGGKWDGWGKQLELAAQRRLARSLCQNTTHWMCSADSFVPPGQQWASWYKPHQLASARAL